MKRGKEILLLCATLAVLFATSGCATTSEDNMSERPWNSQKSWETGLPTGLMQGR